MRCAEVDTERMIRGPTVIETSMPRLPPMAALAPRPANHTVSDPGGACVRPAESRLAPVRPHSDPVLVADRDGRGPSFIAAAHPLLELTAKRIAGSQTHTDPRLAGRITFSTSCPT